MVGSWERVEINGMPAVRLSVKDGTTEANALVYLFGAHVVRWEEKGQAPFLFLSEKALLDGSKPIRGGIPVCFPQFSNFGKLPAHGFVRNSTWALDEKSCTAPESSGDSVSVVLTFRSTAATQAVWDHQFLATYTVTLAGAAGSSLTCSLGIENLSAETPFSFTTALHTYFSIADISKTTVEGLKGLKYLDQLKKQVLEETEQSKAFAQEVDSVYYAVPRQLAIRDAALMRSFNIRSAGFTDAVVWNPWIAKAKAMADFGDEEYKKMVCVEVASIQTPVEVAPGKQWTGTLQMAWSTRSQI